MRLLILLFVSFLLSSNCIATHKILTLAEQTVLLSNKLNFKCRIYNHKLSGRSSQSAANALNVPPDIIIKSLYLKSKDDRGIAAVIRGTDKLDIDKLKSAYQAHYLKLPPLKKLRLAKAEELEKDLGYKPGGVPVIIFNVKTIPTFIDKNVYNLPLVIGSGGTDFDAMEFDPKDTISILGYHLSDISILNNSLTR